MFQNITKTLPISFCLKQMSRFLINYTHAEHLNVLDVKWRPQEKNVTNQFSIFCFWCSSVDKMEYISIIQSEKFLILRNKHFSKKVCNTEIHVHVSTFKIVLL